MKKRDKDILILFPFFFIHFFSLHMGEKENRIADSAINPVSTREKNSTL